MNKLALRTFATSARKELLKKVEAKAMKIGITEETIKKADIESSDAIFIDGKQLSKEEKIQRDKLIVRINQIGFKQVMEEVAYTWFNRFTALRFMEVNDYLPTGVRVLSSSNPNSADPDMLNEALELDLEIDKEYVYELKINNKTEELFKYLVIKLCNDMNRFLPFMFETIDDYTEILFPEGLLAKDSFIRHMANTEVIPEDNWQKVEVIGWLYQYYIAEEKDRVIKAKKKYKKEEIPFATQLFTPDWIVRYMVQNSLGRYWLESHPEHRDLMESWEFYLENSNLDSDFEKRMAPYTNKELKVEDIKCFDPAMGSGHILVYMFDVLYEIYSKCGYIEREIPRLIIENNLYGLDIDDRACQLACFSVVMKALEYNSRFFRSIEREGLTLNLASIQETNTLTDEDIAFMSGENVGENFDKMKLFLEKFKDAKTIGSLIKVESFDKELIRKRIQEIRDNPSKDLFEFEMRDRTFGLLQQILHQAAIIEQKYDVLITNPPYAGNKYLTTEASSYLMKHYADVKSDLFSAFIEYSFHATKDNGQMGFITPFVWMFISSFERIRKKIVEEKNISSLVQLEYNGFEAAMVPVCLFTMRNYQVNVNGEFIKLSDFKGIENQPIKTLEAVQNPNVSYRYSFDQENFRKIPGSPIAYWSSRKAINNFLNKKFSDIAKARAGMITGDNATFTKLWHEVSSTKVGFNHNTRESAIKSQKKWFPYNKGGGFRKWFGNYDYLVDWENDGYNLQNTTDINGKVPAHAFNFDYIFKKAITWSSITSSKFSARSCEGGSLFDAGGSFAKVDQKHDYILGYLNSKVAEYYLNLINPTLNFQKGNIESLPVIESPLEIIIEEIVAKNKKISKNDWDSFETSWGFLQHPLLEQKEKLSTIEASYERWENYAEQRFNQLKASEEELNRTFIEIYGLQEDLTPEVDEKDVTIRKADLERDMKSFISYAIGCSFGRYSLDEEGLVYAGGEFDFSRYKTFLADNDNILPILPGAYFEDDIVSRFVDFIRVTFGEESLSKNLDFVVDAIGRKKGETAREALHRYFLNYFYKDHVQIYKKRPIYWLFTSGKEKAFNCLIYMHRYDKTTLSRIRTDYLHEYQIRLDGERKSLVNIIEGDSTTKEISNAKKELKALDRKIEELKEYDELLHHMADMQIEIDLDDGVKVNYEKFKGLVAKI
ncbi:BREX-1 system adenine-specific DNA-methyltransferase PglX [Priestia megaterium]|uniref:BREX-1 system adenine-specific DNA-methyltransferase PglX n=1 Tax=Priestia megaterium TaxID=1404 RepID=UPI00077D7D9B|nr:BREX-1 system adenine-specific DNA-methyltransferase PglX [Priestia megaterium]